MGPAEILEQTLLLGGRIFLAAVLGVFIAYRRHMDRHRLSILQAHAFLAMAGALFIMIIGDQIERAVGLIGVATVIRYRYAIRNPKDAGTLIIALGLGMASGAGLFGMAVVGAGFVMAVAFLLDLLPQTMPSRILRPQRETQFRIVTTNPEVTMSRLEGLFATAEVPYMLTSLERKQRETGPPHTIIEGTVRFEGELEVSDLTTDIADDNVLQILWREASPGDG